MRSFFHCRVLLLLVLSFLSLYITSSDAALERDATCYSPNGQAAPGNYACFLDQDVSACCGGGSVCEGSGLCRSSGSVGVSELIRGTCTDSSWGSEDCPQFCTDATLGGTNLISCQNVTQSNLDFCCDHTNGCCDSGIGRFQVGMNIDVVTLGASGATFSTSAPASTSSSSSSSSASSSSAAITSSSSSLSAAPASTSAVANPAATTALATPTSENSPLSIQAIAGIGAACGALGVALIIGLVYFCIRRRKRRAAAKESAPAYPELHSDPKARQEMESTSQPRHEMYTEPPELVGNQGTWDAPPAELMGSEGITSNNKKSGFR